MFYACLNLSSSIGNLCPFPRASVPSRPVHRVVSLSVPSSFSRRQVATYLRSDVENALARQQKFRLVGIGTLEYVPLLLVLSYIFLLPSATAILTSLYSYFLLAAYFTFFQTSLHTFQLVSILYSYIRNK